MIGYATFGTNDIERARGFYDALLGEVGAKRLMEIEGFTAYGRAFGEPMICVTPPYDGKEATVGNGAMIALLMDSRADVEKLHAKALELGGKDEGKPGLRPEDGEDGPQAFYAAYFRDLDGNKLCAFKIGPDG